MLGGFPSLTRYTTRASFRLGHISLLPDRIGILFLSEGGRREDGDCCAYGMKFHLVDARLDEEKLLVLRASGCRVYENSNQVFREEYEAYVGDWVVIFTVI